MPDATAAPALAVLDRDSRSSSPSTQSASARPQWTGGQLYGSPATLSSRAVRPRRTTRTRWLRRSSVGPYIVIAPGIALAHSRPSPAVLRAGISLVTLLEPVAFGHRENDPVRLVIGLAAVDEEGHITALSTLAEFLSDETRRRGSHRSWQRRRGRPDGALVRESQAADTPPVDPAARSKGEMS